MKILSWNVKRPMSDEKRVDKILELILSQNADLVFLTETNSVLNLPNYHKIQSRDVVGHFEGIEFNQGENQISIYSKFAIINKIKTYSDFSSVCGIVKTNWGDLILYGSVIGFLGGRTPHFKQDLARQKEDLIQLNLKENICFSGDLNISFSGYPYPSKVVRNEMLDFFEELNLEILTKSVENSAIHIVLSKEFIGDKIIKIAEIEVDKNVSDHHLIVAEIFER